MDECKNIILYQHKLKQCMANFGNAKKELSH